MKNGGCWIFLSHSSKDIEKIRMIRNEFENCGQNPLAFHLKCMSTDTKQKKEELLNLIHREIDARDWFVYCESNNAKNSEYVQDERNYIQQSGKDKIWTIDLSKSDEEIKKRVHEISKDLEVFISYAHSDINFAYALADALAEKDYSVWTDRNLSDNSNWQEQIANSISNAASHGFVIAIISQNTIKSAFCLKELTFALSKNSEIIPIMLGDFELPSILIYHLKDLPCLKISENPTKDDVDFIVKTIDNNLTIKLKK